MDEAEKVRLVRKVDAKSRFIIKAINLANSYRIAQLGPMAHDELRGGFIMGNGGAGISRDAGCVRFPPHPDQTMVQTRDASIPTQFNMLPERFNGFLRRIAPQLMTISPYDLPEIYTRVTGQSDFLFLSRSLKWDKENVDNISTGLFVRSIAENITPNPSDWMFLPISDHLGLLRTDVLAYGAIFTGKTFKFTRGLNHEEFWLLFEPKHPGVSLLGPPRVPGGPAMLRAEVSVKIKLKP